MYDGKGIIVCDLCKKQAVRKCIHEGMYDNSHVVDWVIDLDINKEDIWKPPVYVDLCSECYQKYKRAVQRDREERNLLYPMERMERLWE